MTSGAWMQLVAAGLMVRAPRELRSMNNSMMMVLRTNSWLMAFPDARIAFAPLRHA